jgi:hypothetical protein
VVRREWAHGDRELGLMRRVGRAEDVCRTCARPDGQNAGGVGRVRGGLRGLIGHSRDKSAKKTRASGGNTEMHVRLVSSVAGCQSVGTRADQHDAVVEVMHIESSCMAA